MAKVWCQKLNSEILFVFFLVSKTLFTGVDPLLDSFLPYGPMNFIIALGIRFRIANSCIQLYTYTVARGLLTGSYRMRGGQIYLKIFAPLSSINTYQMNLISAGSIPLDSTFKWVLIVTDEKRVTVNICKLLQRNT